MCFLGMDVPMYVHSTQKISNGFLIGAMVVVIILILLLIDISCCVINRNGILSIVRDKIFNKSELADDEKFNRYLTFFICTYLFLRSNFIIIIMSSMR